MHFSPFRFCSAMKPDQPAPIAPSAIPNASMARPARYSGQMKNRPWPLNRLGPLAQTAAIQATQS